MSETQTAAESATEIDTQTIPDAEAIEAAREFLADQNLTEADLSFTATGVVA